MGCEKFRCLLLIWKYYHRSTTTCIRFHIHVHHHNSNKYTFCPFFLFKDICKWDLLPLTRNLHWRAMRMYPPALAAISVSSFCLKEGQRTPPPPSLKQKDDVEIATSAPDYCRDANLANRFAVFLGLKISILDEKTVFSPIVQYTCVVINLEKNCIFLNPAVFSSKNSTKYCKKGTLGISAIVNTRSSITKIICV